MSGIELLPPNFIALNREADIAVFAQETIDQHPGAQVRYNDETLVNDLCDVLTDWEKALKA